MLQRTCLVFLFIAAVTANESVRPEWLDVNIAQGPVRGHRDPNEDLYVFYNIPYATAPSEEHKFKAPLPPPIWTEMNDAIDRRIVCPQMTWTTIGYTPQEDCLVANIYVPDTVLNNLSVLVIIHGGGFQIGYGEEYTFKNFMKEKDFIIVTFNYRLGIHGFLCLGTEDVPGNAGMKDQVALLHWVQQNIAAFGGNPNDVTLEGCSAGSVSADLLMISKSAQGLFHRVMGGSGSNIAVFATQSNPLQIAKDHAKTLNFTNVDDIDALEQFYKTLPYEVLTEDPFMDRADSTFSFVPCVERYTDGAFLTESPVSILKKEDYNKVPLLYGFANMEGLFRVMFFDTWKDKMNETFSDFLPADLKFESEIERERVANQIKEFYFGDKPIDNESILGYVDYFSDILFAYAKLRAVKLHVDAGHDQVYLYEYSFVDEDTPVVPHTDIRGAYHCAQTWAVADGVNSTHLSEDYLTAEYITMKRIIREMWHNFMKTGKPVPEGSSLPTWLATGVNRSPHMSLGQDVELGGRLLEARTIFWDNIYEKYYREPIAPSSASDIKERYTFIFLCLIVCYKLF